MNERNRSLFVSSATFASFMTVFLTVFWQASHGSAGILSDSEGNIVSYINAILCHPGFASVALACRVFRADRARSAVATGFRSKHARG